MTCTVCKHHFCWVCMGDWSQHGSATGGYYNCNLFQEKKTKDSSFADEEKKREEATNEITRYAHYYERYINHERSERLATNLLPKIEVSCKILNDHMSYPWQETEFLPNACRTVIECRNVLKWTYALAFFRGKYWKESFKALFEQW